MHFCNDYLRCCLCLCYLNALQLETECDNYASLYCKKIKVIDGAAAWIFECKTKDLKYRLHESRNSSIITTIYYSFGTSNGSFEYMVQPCSNMYLTYLMSCFYSFNIQFASLFCCEKILAMLMLFNNLIFFSKVWYPLLPKV